MTEPRRIGELLAETLAAIRAAGPILTKLDVSPQLYATLGRAHFADQALHGYSAGVWLGVPVIVDRKLPPYARREHYSDGRVVTRYRLVMDPRVLQVRFRDQEYGIRANRGERHGLSLMVKGFGWDYATRDGRDLTSAWKGARSCPYLPGLKALTDMAGLELTDWQRDYVTKAMEAHHAGLRVSIHVPRMHGLGGGTL